MSCACKLKSSSSSQENDVPRIPVVSIEYSDTEPKMTMLFFDVTPATACFARKTQALNVEVGGKVYSGYFDHSPHAGKGCVCVPGVQLDTRDMSFPDMKNFPECKIAPAQKHSLANTWVDSRTTKYDFSTPPPPLSASPSTPSPLAKFPEPSLGKCLDLEACLQAQREFANELRQKFENPAGVSDTMSWQPGSGAKCTNITTLVAIIAVCLMTAFVLGVIAYFLQKKRKS